MSMVYTIEFAVSVKAQLRELTARQRSEVFDSIERQLIHEPLVETKTENRFGQILLRLGNYV